ncbi:hypothetical protein OZY48_07555 [Aliarcobacter cryaerophilus]|uniref:hypothetical protein n=1 Tax=Aliarcobacter cryaerophilus TaxID=28198 RepID=UPI003BAE815D
MSKNENKGPLKKILTIVENVLVGTFLLLSIYVFFIVPTYPKIDKSLPFNVINIKIKSQIEQNISQVSLEYANDKKKRLKLKKAIHIMANNMDKCKTKECLIAEYEDFMDDWVSTRTKTSTRYYHIAEFGFIGDFINGIYEKTYGWF